MPAFIWRISFPVVTTVAFISATSSLAEGLAGAFASARTIKQLVNTSSSIRRLYVETDAIACEVNLSDTSSVVYAWDGDGDQLFELVSLDTSIAADNGADISYSLTGISPDGSKFSCGFWTMLRIVDRDGKSLSSASTVTMPRFSGNGTYWVPYSCYEGCYEADFEIHDYTGRDIELDSFPGSLARPNRYRTGAFFGDDRLLLEYATGQAGIFALPQGNLLKPLGSLPVVCSGEPWTLSDPSGRKMAVWAYPGPIYVISADGDILWRDDTLEVQLVAFDEFGQQMFVVNGPSRRPRQLLLVDFVPNVSIKIVAESFGNDHDHWETFDISTNSAANTAIMLLSNWDRHKSMALFLDLPLAEVIDSTRLDCVYRLIPQESNRLARARGKVEERHGRLGESYSVVKYHELELIEVDWPRQIPDRSD